MSTYHWIKEEATQDANASHSIKSFIEKMGDDPVKALEWSASIFETVARQDVAKRVLRIIEELEARFIPESSNGMASEAEAYTIDCELEEILAYHATGTASGMGDSNLFSANQMERYRIKAWASYAYTMIRQRQFKAAENRRKESSNV